METLSKSKTITAAILAVTLLPTASLANTTMVGCPGHVIALSDEAAIEAQSRIGSEAAFERTVCERSKDLNPSQYSNPTRVPIFIEDLNVSTRVVIFPTNDDN